MYFLKVCSEQTLRKYCFFTGSRCYTDRFATCVVDLLKAMTLKDPSSLLDVPWNVLIMCPIF
jgi:hypothetical protein